ncbi:MAG: PP2C family protein-serine/threonine phosphatase [Candidatus Bipolaricaulia bacterium]
MATESEREELLKLERELQIARKIQADFLPDTLPQPDGWEIAARFHPAREVAGDFYDAFPLAQDRRVGFVIADVCDKGVGAALFMALIRSLVRAFAQQHYSLSWMDELSPDWLSDDAPGRSVEQRRAVLSTGTTALKNAVVLTNNYILQNHEQANMFATLFFGVLDPATGSLNYVNGGHNPPFIVGPDGVKARLTPTGPAVGMFADVDFNIEQAQLDPGDILITYTDGVPEARDPDGKFFTEKRLLSLVEPSAPSATALLDRIETNLDAHIAEADQFDDITMLAVRRAPASEA